MTKYTSVDITDPGGANSPTSVYLQDRDGRRAGFVNGVTVTDIPGSWAGDAAGWPSDVGADGPAAAVAAPLATANDATTPTGPRAITVADPQPGLTLHVVAGASGSYGLSADAWTGGTPTAHDDLLAASTPGEDTVVASHALETLIGDVQGGGQTGGGQTGGDQITKVVLVSRSVRSGKPLTFEVTLKAPARIRLTLLRPSPTAGHGKRRRKRLYVALATFSFPGKRGLNRPVIAKARRRNLPAGNYKAILAAGGPQHVLTFNVRR